MIPGSATNLATANPNGIDIYLANDVNTFLANGKPLFKHGLNLPGTPPDWTILYICFLIILR